MKQLESGLSGCFVLQGDLFKDDRGTFLKTYQIELFEKIGLRTDWKEEYYSVSGKDVIRGLHFQTPPADHAKLVYCVEGEVLDVIVDLRVDSPTYLECRSFLLSPQRANSLYIPSGLAHGFLSLTEGSVVHYKVTSAYSAEHDTGILWSSVSFEWPVTNPVISNRDLNHVPVDQFCSPFS